MVSSRFWSKNIPIKIRGFPDDIALSGGFGDDMPLWERHAGNPQPCSKSECQSRTVSPWENDVSDLHADNDFVFHSESQGLDYQRNIQNLILMFQNEYHEALIGQKETRSHRRLDLLEVMCSSSSELTNQMLRLGGSAMRFGVSEGDLSSPEGRFKLFQVIIKYRPKHLWFSPECGPWCLWSNLNMNKSL